MPWIEEKLFPRGMFRVLVCKQPPGTARVFVGPLPPLFEMVGHGIITVKIGDICNNVKIAPARRVPYNEPGWIKRLKPMVGFSQPGTLGWVSQVDAPAFIDNGPDPDAGMVAIPFEHAHQCLSSTTLSILR